VPRNQDLASLYHLVFLAAPELMDATLLRKALRKFRWLEKHNKNPFSQNGGEKWRFAMVESVKNSPLWDEHPATLPTN